MDTLNANERSALMAKVRSHGTQPEIRARRVSHSLGLRFRLRRRDLPGSPDLVFPKYKIALFIHGCFWHQHTDCKRASLPKTNADFWRVKLDRNVERDYETQSAIESLGWKYVVIWECETRQKSALRTLLIKIFDLKIVNT